MPSQPSDSGEAELLLPLPLSQALWNQIAGELALSPQQKKIVELILRGQQDKQIASRVGLQLPTVKTYLRRIFQSTQTSDRMQLVLLIFKRAQESVNAA